MNDPVEARHPLFFFHHFLTDISLVRALAPHIDSSFSIYELPDEPEPTQLRTVEAMARRFVGLLQAVQPSGPYRQYGHSVG